MIEIIEGKAVVSEEAMVLPVFKKMYLRDKKSGKLLFETWMRFVYFAYDKDSIYKNYPPGERETKVIETIFPNKTVKGFKSIVGMTALIEFYIEYSYSFKELLYRRLLEDVETMMMRLSKVEITKSVRVNGNRDITFFSRELKKEVTENIDIDVRITIDNSDEKIKAMDVIDKLLKRELILKKALKEEQVENDLKKASERRMFDQ